MEIQVTADGRLSWPGGAVRCVLGRGGVRHDKREGDGATPVGRFAIRRVLYRPDRLPPPATRLPVAAIDPADGWCDDPGHPEYNRPVRLPFPARHEVMWREDRLYDVVVVLGHNDDPVVPGAGSAVFLHVAKPDREPTAGCVALDLPDLLRLLADCAPGDALTVADPGEASADTGLAGTIARNIEAVRASMTRAAEAANRDPRAVSLVAVSKTHPESAVRAAILAGQRIFGENRVQEAKAKFAGLRAEFPDLELHLVGPLQTNKVRDAVAHFDVIQSVDRASLAAELAKEMERAGRRPRLLVQVNTGAEPQKAGVPPGELDGLLEACASLGLGVEGLMCIPPMDEEPALHFALLANLAAARGLAALSMGMSGDFETAIRFGATHVRVGTAVFGARTPPT